MRIVQINLTYAIGSTGHIIADLSNVIEKSGHESYMVCGYTNKKNIKNLYVMQTLPAKWDLRKDILISRLTGRMGYNSRHETAKMVKWLKDVHPDIVHLHNIHGNFLNLKMLFDYLKSEDIPVVWTLHDCWSFTGRCSYFELHGCDQWKTGCTKCMQKQKKIYPITYFFDFSKRMWKDKRRLFSSVSKMYIVTPSMWLKKYVDLSYLGKYESSVIHNGINLDVFRPIETKSPYILNESRKIILGVASSWTERKGLNDFIKIDQMLDHNKYVIVLVGLNDRQLQALPETMVGIKRTHNVRELVELYCNADVFANPTYLDNYPTVNLESAACGTPVVTYRTGGSPESVSSSVGIVVDQGNVDFLYSALMDVMNENIKHDAIIQYAKDHFDKNKTYEEYIALYQNIYSDRMG